VRESARKGRSGVIENWNPDRRRGKGKERKRGETLQEQRIASHSFLEKTPRLVALLWDISIDLQTGRQSVPIEDSCIRPTRLN